MIYGRGEPLHGGAQSFETPGLPSLRQAPQGRCKAVVSTSYTGSVARSWNP